MLTYQQMTQALTEALDVSRSQGCCAVAIVKRDKPRGWWDKWNTKPYTIEYQRRDLDPATIIVCDIVAPNPFA